MNRLSKSALIAAIVLALPINLAAAKGGGNNGGNHNATTTSSQATKTSSSGQLGQQQKANMRKSAGDSTKAGSPYLQYRYK
jgi:hypothetical protein